MASKILRTDSTHPDFIKLVALLDADLAVRDGEDHTFYHQFNAITTLKYVILLYKDDKAVGCGAIKPFEESAMEVKRMYVLPEQRGQGLATIILNNLEAWAHKLSYAKCVLETGKKQPEAIRLYEKSGYKRIQNYGQYAGVENSVCFEKKLKTNQ